MAGLTTAESQLTLDARFPTSAATDYVAYSINGSSEWANLARTAVGATGWATGPHLHYEFKISGAHQDPMRVALPKATPVPAASKSRFDATATEARSTLGRVRTVANALRFD